MKIQCEVCEKAEAEVLCCADEAVLCGRCDEKVHTANKLSQKHQRVSLLKHPDPVASSSSSSSQLPLCDICQERNGYFFCLEDRAILCRHCDMSIHIASAYISSHQRFLIGGIKVALESLTKDNDTDFEGGNYQGLMCEENRTAMSVDVGTNFSETTASSGEPHLGLGVAASSWPFDDILGTDDFNNYYEFSDMESSRVTGQ